MNQTCILILGMHRSGTSALTGLLQIMGVKLGYDLISASEDNKKGFFENKHFLAFNKFYLKDNHTPLEDINYSININKNKQQAIEKLKKIILKNFNKTSLFAIKDPRISYIFELYQQALDELKINIVCLIPIRHPLEVAHSLQRRNNMSINKALLLWSEHILLTENVTREYPRVFLNFDDYLNNPIETLSSLSEKLNISFPNNTSQQEKKILQFLDSDLKHNVSLTTNKDLPYVIKELIKININHINSYNQLFDTLSLEFKNYKNLFYHKDIICDSNLENTLDNQKTQINHYIQKIDHLNKESDLLNTQFKERLKETHSNYKKTLKAKDSLLTEKTFAIKESNAALSQTRLTIKKQQLGAVQLQKTLKYRNSQLVQNSLTLKESNDALTHTRLLLKNQQQDFIQLQHETKNKESQLAKAKLTIDKNNAALSQTQLSLENQQKAFAQIQQVLKDKENLLSQSTLALDKSNIALSKALLSLENKKHGYVQNNIIFNKKNNLLQTNIAVLKNQIEELKDELVIIYTGRAYGLIRFIKNTKGYFK